MNWRQIWAITVGKEPGVDFVHPLLASLLFYVITYLICFVLYTISKQILPASLKIYLLDFFKTLVFCAYPYGHGLVRNVGGHIAFCIVAVPLVLFTLRTFKEGSHSPLGIFQNIIEKKNKSYLGSLVRILVQTAAGFASFQLVQLIWLLEFHPDHVSRLKAIGCDSDLKVSILFGFLVETFGVLYDTWLSKQKLSKIPFLDDSVKIFNGTLLVCIGLHWTGMYMHPAMASGLSFGCRGTSAWEHILVYWVGGFLGCFGAIVLNKYVHFSLVKSKSKKAKDMNGKQKVENGKKRNSKRKKKG